MNDPIDILLATYQGAHYLPEQLSSLLAQSYPYFHIWVRDDGSSDETLAQIDAFRRAHPERLTLLSSTGRLGVRGNFSALMRHAKAYYVMFCDQDDVWLPHKVEVTLLRMKESEEREGRETPLLVHTDLQVVQADLAPIAPSFWGYTGIDPEATSLRALLRQNVVTGCASLINRPLLELAYPISPNSLMHDWWLALVAALFGKIEFIPEATLLYRQHGRNSLGAKKLTVWSLIKQLIKKRLPITTHEHFQQAQSLLQRYAHLLNASQQKVLHAFCFRTLKVNFRPK